MFDLQKVDYAKLLNDDEDDEEVNGEATTNAFSSDEDFGANGAGAVGNSDNSVQDIDDSPVKKPAPKRKLAPKRETPKATVGKRKVVVMSDSESSDYGAKRNVS